MILAIGAVAFGRVAVMSYKPLYDRFFGYDASMSVGLNVNASGRTATWNGLLENLGNDWSSWRRNCRLGNYIDSYFPELGYLH